MQGRSRCEICPHGIVQVNQLLELESVQTVTTQKYKAIDKWSQHLHTLHQSILNKMT